MKRQPETPAAFVARMAAKGKPFMAADLAANCGMTDHVAGVTLRAMARKGDVVPADRSREGSQTIYLAPGQPALPPVPKYVRPHARIEDRILAAMTDEPSMVRDIAARTGMDAHDLNGRIRGLASRGKVRRVGSVINDRGKNVWLYVRAAAAPQTPDFCPVAGKEGVSGVGVAAGGAEPASAAKNQGVLT